MHSIIPIRGHLVYETWAQIRRKARQVIRRRRTLLFYIGRSNNPWRRAGEHGADRVDVLFETSSVGRAMDVEQWLLDVFDSEPGCLNENIHCGGGVGAGRQYVYIATWTQEYS